MYSYQIYLAVFNLRGNCRTSGEQRRKESGNVFGEGSRTPISITILVRKPKKSTEDLATILYKDIGDYLTREDKLKAIQSCGSILSNSMGLSSIAPNEVEDWINQRDGLFETFIPLGDKNAKNENAIFTPCYSCGVKTNRDSWVYNFSRKDLERNISSMIDFYNANVEELLSERKSTPQSPSDQIIHLDSHKISWTRGLRNDFEKGKKHPFLPDCIQTATYRPFVKQHYYFDRAFNDMVYQIPRLFPTPQSKNLVICVSGVGAKTFSTLMTDEIPDLHILESGTQCFPLYWYERCDHDALSLFDNTEEGFRRHSAMSDFSLQRFRESFGPKVSAEDIFYYVYGILHVREYRERFASDLQKSLARLPLVEDVRTFKVFVTTGRKLAALHLNYETIEPHPSVIIENDSATPRVQQMRFGKKNGEEDRSIIIFNESIRIVNIPLRAYEWHVNGKSPIEWIMERYAVTVNKDSQIRNDPNEWCAEHGNPRYILDLIGRIVNVSVQTLDLIAALPPLSFKPAAD